MANSSEIEEQNKAVVRRFNKEVVEQGSAAAFGELMAPAFVNRTALPNMPAGPEGMRYMLEKVLRPAFPDLTVEIHDQIAEGDKVVTRKTIHGTHRGPLLDIPPTQRKIKIEVIDIVRVQDGKYLEHWGINTLQIVAAQLRAAGA